VLLATAPCATAQAQRDAPGALRIPLPRDEGSLTPTTFRTAYPLVTLIYDTLMWRDEDGSPQPWLARSVRTSAAGRRVTLRLREGARWHDGRPLTARDVAFTFRFFKSRFHPRFTPQLSSVAGARAAGAGTVVVDLRRPSPGFLDQPLSDMPILPRHLWRGLPAGRLAPPGPAVGSGPYRLVEHRPGKRYRFAANRGYFLGRPRVRRIDVPIVREFGRTVRALESRNVDMIPATLPDDTRERLRGASFETAEGALYTGTALTFNLRTPPFDRLEVRRAVSAALDLRRLRLTAAGPGAVAADRGYFHPESGWAPTGAIHEFAPEAARRVLSRPDLPPLEILAPDNDPVRQEAGRQVALALERLGARARLKAMPADRLAAAVGQDGSTPTFSAAIWSTPPLASYDPDYLRLVFGSDARRAPLNLSGYRSREFDRLAEQVASEPNPDERDRAVRRELRLLAGDLPVVPLFFAEGAFTYRPDVYDGWLFVKGTGILDKRSFLPRSGRATSVRPAAPPSPAASSPPGRIGVPGLIALGLLGLVAVAAAAALVGNRRRPRRR